MTWKVIEFLIYLKTVVYSVPTILSLDNDITNTYSNYLASIAATIEESVKYSRKHFSDYLVNESCSTIFLQPTDKEEIANIISSPNSNKASSSPNSIPYRTMFLLKNEYSKQLADLLNPFHWCFSISTPN